MRVPNISPVVAARDPDNRRVVGERPDDVAHRGAGRAAVHESDNDIGPTDVDDVVGEDRTSIVLASGIDRVVDASVDPTTHDAERGGELERAESENERSGLACRYARSSDVHA